MKRRNKIVHVELKASQTHLYFSSLKAIFNTLTRDEVGCGYKHLTTLKLYEDGARYENKCCIIRIGTLLSMPQQKTHDYEMQDEKY
ncbi:MAG: hypothetical protein IKP11_04590 [Paludibacteraceae bacterium]|nr:hypothetical protein [Paludibacteraceae bacterium]